MADLITIGGIAELYGVDRKTAHYWTTRPWFPAPKQRARGRGHPTLYDIAAVRKAKRKYDRTRAGGRYVTKNGGTR